MSHQKLETVRSDILVHWTGKKICKDHTNLKQHHRQKYIERLHSILKKGLWMNHVDIDIHHHSRFEPIKFSWPATCFTETKLSDIGRHIGYYGLLGCGFTREFVMKRDGGPVLYVAGIKELSKSKGMRSITSRHFYKLFKVLEFLAEKTSNPRSTGFAEFIKFIQTIKLEQFMKDLASYGEPLDSRPIEKILGSLFSSVITCAIFVKVMSDEDCEYAYQRLDEAEWRIPWETTLPDVDPPMVNVNPPKSKVNPAAKIPFYPSDLKYLILPDGCTRKMVYDDQEIMGWFGGERPCIKTVEECLNDKSNPKIATGA